MPKSKKAKLQDEVPDEESDEEEDGSESSISTEVVQADFEAFAPIEGDFGGIRSLLQQLLLKAPVNVNELTEVIIQQSDIGCVHKVATDEDAQQGEDAMETDEDVYGLVTIVDLKSDEKECIRQLKAMLRKRYGEISSKSPLSEKAKAAFDQLWKSEKAKRVGWIINERLVNIPFQIAVPSFESLLEELDASNTKFDQFLAILKIHKMNTSGDSGASASASGGDAGQKGRKSGKKRNKRKDGQNIDMVVYANSEEELLFEECDCSFDYCVSNETEGGVLGDRLTEDGSYKPYRRVIMFDRASLENFLTKLKSVEND